LQEARSHGNSTQKELIAEIEFVSTLASQLIGEQEVIQQEVFQRTQVQSQGPEER
jgi:hypothetical protein